jgi:F-type H+-transporting ATPase subunit delta
MPIDTAAARRYARAIVDVAVARGELEALVKELEAFAVLFAESFDLRNALISPAFTATDRKRVLDVVLSRAGLSEMSARLATLLSDRNRFGLFPEIVKAARRLADARAGRVRAEVQAAAPLSPPATESLRRALEKRTGKSVELHVEIDPSLLGGVRARIGSMVLDGTLRSQLEQLRESLLRA